MNKPSITIRTENPEDYQQSENVIREAFWDLYRPGCFEHFIIHKIRNTSAYIKELDLVACDENKIIGVIICLKGTIKNENKQETTALSMIVGVLPSHQKEGIGSLLINKAIETAKLLEYKGIIIFGDPNYYSRFGFKNAKEYGIQTSDGDNFDQFMALELSPNSLKESQGRFYEDPAFQPPSDPNELESFDKQFPKKEKHVTDTQLKF